ncbi:MAG: ATP-dependent RNA helicase HrpA, partial [Planctomycetota bacterium]
MDPRLRQLARRLESCLVTDRFRIARQLRELRASLESGKPTDRLGPLVVAEVDRAVDRAARRAKALPRTSYPPDLPVTQRRDEIAQAIRDHQVVVVCGETGSGKTTQLPKICLDAGRGLTGMIGHTQPRRIAARSVAARIAHELDIPLGKGVGYKVRFGDKTSPDTFLKVMTDGMLLTETQHDRPLAHYDTLIIDEAHERSLNIDFLLGYLRQLLPRRPDLKLIITSATIDPKRFSAHFGDCPVIEVSGRTYPVEVRYRSLAAQSEADDDLRLDEGVIRSVEELIYEGPGDILVFLPGEREIRMIADDLRAHFPPTALEIVPLYARLSAAEQERVFANHTTRRVVLSTNVAETSLTVPGIRSVIDAGLARISRYSTGTKVQRLPVEAISKASANQRSGRCGRLGPGIAVRLYSQSDFDGRDAFTDPEIQRTNLASVILQMIALGLGNPENFPFLDPPDGRQIRDGYDTLRELGAMDDENKLTPLGHKLAKLPVDPRIARMILAGHDEHCLAELLVIASALSVEDPRDRPMEMADKADEAHAQFDDPDSDFIGLLNLWREFRRLEAELSSGKLRKWCHQNFINWMKVREWSSTHEQLSRLATTLDLKANTLPAEKDAVHRAMLTGLLCNLGKKHEEGGYTGCRNTRFHIFPGSSLFRKGPQFVMAAELVQTTKLYAREVARIDPAWVERLAAHLIKRTHTEPHWDKDAGQVFAYEKVTLLGLELVSRRRVHFGPIDPPAAREIFIQLALVDEQLVSPAPFWRHNRDLVTYLKNLSERARRADIAVDPRLVFEFYDKRLPPDIYSTVSLDMWRKHAERASAKVLFMSEADLTPKAAHEISPDQFPDKLETFGTRLNLQYKYDTTKPDDGVTITVPLQTLHQLDPQTLEWLIPGLLPAKVA